MALYRSDPYSIMDDQLFSNISIFDMDNDLYDMDKLLSSSTIQSDLEKIEDMESVFQDYDLEEDMKPEIRNIDCMWPAMSSCLTSGNGNGIESGNSAASSYSETGAVSLAMVSGSTNLYSAYQRSQTTDNTQSNQQHVVNSAENMPVIIKKELADLDYTVCQKRLRLSGGDKKSQIQDEVHLIPPGGSLLRKRNNQDIIRKSGELSGSDSIKYQRPDTPHSLTDEVAASEFRHNVDLRACVMGSNNISLTGNDSDVNYIKQISRELQNTGKDPLPVRYIPPINDVLDVLNQHSNSTGGQQQLNQQQLDEQQQAIDIATGRNTVDSPPTTGSDSDSDDGEPLNFDLRHHRTSKSGSNASITTNSNNKNNKIKNNNNNSNGMLHMMHITDHSYTRCNDMVDDGPNLETPSDSDEEIDVVSYTDKKLPTNPSCHLMGALQFQMAHKISIDHMKQKPRYNNFNLPYTPASSSPVKSVANSRYPSPSSTPYQNCSSASPSYSPLSVDSSNVSSSSSSSSSQSSFTTSSSNKGRKRSSLKDPGLLISSSSVYLPGVNNKVTHSSMMSKKSRGKKVVGTSSGNTSPISSGQDVDAMDRNWQRRSGGIATSTSSNSSVHRKDFVLGFDEADTIEKRNQHNDMERQRRIGLKNLFEALKKQIPTIRDKERAPKVNILREAAKLCIQLTQEEKELSMQRQLLSLQLKQRQDTLASYQMELNESRSVSG